VSLSAEALSELPVGVRDGLDEGSSVGLAGLLLGVPVASPSASFAGQVGVALPLVALAVDAGSSLVVGVASRVGVSAGAVSADPSESRAVRATAPGDPPSPAPTRSERVAVVPPCPTATGDVSSAVVLPVAGLPGAEELPTAGLTAAVLPGAATVVRGAMVASADGEPPLVAATVTPSPAAATIPATAAATAKRRRGAPDRLVTGAVPPTVSDPDG